MKLLVVRHATAADKEEFARAGKDDDLRPLTPEGQEEMRKVARGIHAMVREIDILATSPLTRAVQTAEILSEVYGRTPVPAEWLRPEASFEDFAQWAHAHDEKRVVVIVGHEPHLSGLVSWLTAGSDRSLLELKKAGACLLELEGEMGPESGMLVWAIGPKQLRAIGKR